MAETTDKYDDEQFLIGLAEYFRDEGGEDNYDNADRLENIARRLRKVERY